MPAHVRDVEALVLQTFGDVDDSDIYSELVQLRNTVVDKQPFTTKRT
jgi:hypothetical protein